MSFFSFSIPSELTRVPDRLTEMSRSFDRRCSSPSSPTWVLSSDSLMSWS